MNNLNILFNSAKLLSLSLTLNGKQFNWKQLILIDLKLVWRWFELRYGTDHYWKETTIRNKKQTKISLEPNANPSIIAFDIYSFRMYDVNAYREWRNSIQFSSSWNVSLETLFPRNSTLQVSPLSLSTTLAQWIRTCLFDQYKVKISLKSMFCDQNVHRNERAHLIIPPTTYPSISVIFDFVVVVIFFSSISVCFCF